MSELRFDGRRRGRRKVDRFLADKSLVIDYKDPSVLKYFVTERGKIVPRRVSGLCAKNQRKITQAIAVPTIGIGASVACDGQVLVLEDMLGLSARAPKFVRRYGNLGPAIEEAVSGYARDVKSRAFPGPEHVYGMKKS